MNQSDQSLTGPARAVTRIEALDALRGFAVLGIFIINIIGFSMPDIAFYNPVSVGGDGALNHGLWTITQIFVEGSMRGLFSLMFGAGVVLFTERSAYPDGPIKIADLFYRRTTWLILFGVIHAYVLLMPGDILLLYGMTGLLLFPFRLLTPTKLVLIAGVILTAFTIYTFSDEYPQTQTGLVAEAIQARQDAGETIASSDQEILDEWNDAVTGNWPEPEKINALIDNRVGDIPTLFASNAEIMSDYSVGGYVWGVADAFMMMLLGMAFYKWRIITAERSRRFYLLLMAGGYAVGLSFRIWAVWTRWDADFSPILWAPWTFEQIGRVAMTIGHIGLFFTLWKSLSSSLPMRALTAAGRMALTNYLTQTIIANLIFTGIGLGLYGSLDRAQVYLIMIVIWIFQLAFSMWWLGRYRFGPFEWGWRSLTYWRLQPLRKAPVDTGADK